MTLQPADFRAPKDFSERLAAAPKVRSPRGDEDVRLHPEWCWEDALVTKHRGKSFLVTQALSELLAGKMFRASLFAAASSQAGLFIWPVKLTAESAVEAAKTATTRWCCIRWDNLTKAYKVEESEERHEDPNWRYESFDHLVGIAFAKQILTTPDDKIVREILGS